MVWHALKEARAQKSNLTVIWFDTANVYESIPHKLIAFDMVSLLSGSDSLKHITKGFSINHFLNQQLVPPLFLESRLYFLGA